MDVRHLLCSHWPNARIDEGVQIEGPNLTAHPSLARWFFWRLHVVRAQRRRCEMSLDSQKSYTRGIFSKRECNSAFTHVQPKDLHSYH